jgi:hypothetical protein
MAKDVARTTMAFFRLQTPVLLRPSRKWDRVLNDPGKENVFASVEIENLVDTWLYRVQLEFIWR